MKGSIINTLLIVLLVSLVGCRSNTEGIMESKISKIDQVITNPAPYKKERKKSSHSRIEVKNVNSKSEELDSDLPVIVSKNEYDWNNLSDEQILSEAFSKFSEQKQVFYFYSEKDISLTCSKGTVISIEAGAFVNYSSEVVSGKIKFEVTEYLSKSDFFFANLSSFTNRDNFLGCAGVLKLKAYSGNQELMIDEGKSIRIKIAAQNTEEKEELFFGVRDEYGIMKWHERIGDNKSEKINSVEDEMTTVSVDAKNLTSEIEGAAGFAQERGNSYAKIENKYSEKFSLKAKKSLKDISSKISGKNKSTKKEILFENGYHVLATPKLGWINIARSVRVRGNKTKIVMENINFENSKASLIFRKEGLIIPGYIEEGKLIFEHVPVGEEATLVIVKINNGIPMLVMEEVSVAKRKLMAGVKFNAVDFSSIKETINRIN